MTLITCINQPLWGCISIYTLVVGRFLYAVGYCKSGPKGRVLGAIITDLALLAVLIGGFVSIFTWDTNRLLPISDVKYAEVALL